MLNHRHLIKLIAVVLLAVPVPALAVKTNLQITLPPALAAGEANLNLVIPSGTLKSTQDPNSPISLFPISGQTNKANVELDLNEGDGLYNLTGGDGESFGVIPINDDQVVEIGDDSVIDTILDSRVDIRISTSRGTGQNKTPAGANVTITEVGGDPDARREYTRNTGADGANGSATVNQATGNFYRITVTYTDAAGNQQSFIRYQLIRKGMSHIDINLDDPGVAMNQLLSWDRFFRANGMQNGLPAVREQLDFLNNYYQNQTGMHIVNGLPTDVQVLVRGFKERLSNATTKDGKLQVIRDARADIDGDVQQFGDRLNPNAVQQARQALDQLEQFYNSPNYNQTLDQQLKNTERMLDHRDAQSRTAQPSDTGTQTRQPDVAQGEAAKDLIGLYTTSGQVAGSLPGGGTGGETMSTSLRSTKTYVSPTYGGFTLTSEWGEEDSGWTIGAEYTFESAGPKLKADAAYSTGSNSDYFADTGNPVGMALGWERQVGDLFAGVFDLAGKGAGQDTGYQAVYTGENWSVPWQWQPNLTLGQSLQAEGQQNSFLDGFQQSGQGATVKGSAVGDNWSQDRFPIDANLKLNEWNLGGYINYKAIGDQYNEVVRGDIQWNSNMGAWRKDLSVTLDFSYLSDTSELTDLQLDALNYNGSLSGVRTEFSTYNIGGMVYAGTVNYTINNPPPDVEAKSFRVPLKFEQRLGGAFDGFLRSERSETKAAAGARGKSVADPPAQSKQLPNDGFFHSKGSWGQDFDDQWGLKRIGFRGTDRDGEGSLWPKKGKPVVVAVVDTGIDFGHPELAGKLWINGKDRPNNDKDDDNNHHKNDFVGWNFVHDGNNTFDDNGHGTFIAGIIAARTDNGLGMAGINPWARIMPVKVADMYGDSNDVDVAQGIAYAAHMGAKVINVSMGGRKLSRIEQAAVDEAVKRGAVVVVAAGNENEDLKDVTPAGLKGVITVTATDQNDKRTKYSNWGAQADIAAPGDDILSLRAIQTDLLQFVDKKYKAGSNVMGTHRHYYRLSGTSFSAPYVSGVASLLLSLHPELTPAQVKRMILHSAKDIEIPGIDQFTGYGLLDAAAALKADPEFFVEARIDGIAVAQADGQQVVQVSGRVDADQYKTAWVEIGAGDDPKEWKRVAEDIDKTSETGVLANIPAGSFTGSKVWIIKVVSEHENGKQRENRFVLKVG